MRLVLPRVYVILDAALLNIPEKDCARKLADAGVRLIQYRNKNASARELFERSRELAAFLNPIGVKFIVNDRADVASPAWEARSSGRGAADSVAGFLALISLAL